MRIMERLKKEARKGCQWREHKMGNFHRIDFWSPLKVQESNCKICGRTVYVNTCPMPNETDIYGDAIAVNCRK